MKTIFVAYRMYNEDFLENAIIIMANSKEEAKQIAKEYFKTSFVNVCIARKTKYNNILII